MTIHLGRAVVLIVSLVGVAVNAAEPLRLRVLCYNIHYGQGMDGAYDIERLAAVINRVQPDLVALQEVDVGVKRSGRLHEAQLLGKMTGLAVRFGPTQHYEGGLFGNAVLTRFPILDVVIQPLPYTESTPELVTYPRAAIAVTVRGPDDKPLRFISTHFQHNVPADRVAEALCLAGACLAAVHLLPIPGLLDATSGEGSDAFKGAGLERSFVFPELWLGGWEWPTDPLARQVHRVWGLGVLLAGAGFAGSLGGAGGDGAFVGLLGLRITRGAHAG